MLRGLQQGLEASLAVTKKATRGRYRYKIYHPHIANFFRKNESRAIGAFCWFQHHYNISNLDAVSLFNRHPTIFKFFNLQRIYFQKRMTFLQRLSKEDTLVRAFSRNMVKNDFLLFRMSEKEILGLLTRLKAKIPQYFARLILASNANLISPKFQQILFNRMNILRSYLNISDHRIYQILSGQPYLLNASENKLTQSLQFFAIYKKHVSSEQTATLLQSFGEVFLMGREQLKTIFDYYLSWGIKAKELWPILLGNPLLFLNYPFQIMPLKRKLFKYFEFTCQMGLLMLRKHPSILICSVASLQAKLIFLRDRLQLPINSTTLPLLAFKFNKCLRPRGEICIRAQKDYSITKLISVMRLSDIGFAREVGVPLPTLRAETRKHKATLEMDILKKKVYRGQTNYNKMVYAAEHYYHYQAQPQFLKKKKYSRSTEVPTCREAMSHLRVLIRWKRAVHHLRRNTKGVKRPRWKVYNKQNAPILVTTDTKKQQSNAL